LERLARRLLPLVLILALTACGVDFKTTYDDTELFKSVSLGGDRLVNADLTLSVVVTPAYPVPVHVACYYENGDALTDDQLNRSFIERAERIGETVLPPSAGRKPDDDVPEQTLSFHFSIPAPGEYFLACLTPAAADNGLGLLFTIRQAPAAAGSR
jgi:hypothetical protein